MTFRRIKNVKSLDEVLETKAPIIIRCFNFGCYATYGYTQLLKKTVEALKKS